MYEENIIPDSEEGNILQKNTSKNEDKKELIAQEMTKDIDLFSIEKLLLDIWKLISPSKYYSIIGKTYLSEYPLDRPLKLNDLLFLRDALFADFMEDYLDETFENIVTDNVTMNMEYEKNKDQFIEDDDKQKTCLHAFEVFFNIFLGNNNNNKNESLDSSVYSLSSPV